MNEYIEKIRQRSLIRYYIGLIVRFKQNVKYAIARYIAKKNGAEIGEGVLLSIKLARKVNSNFHVGNHTSVGTDNFTSFRYPIFIGNNVIIGEYVRFTMGGHNIDSLEWEHFRPNEKLVIEDYVWVCPYANIMPSCSHIGRGAVIGANSVVVKNVEEMSVVSGFPAKELRKRKVVHENLIVESLRGGDYYIYKKARKQ